MNVTTTADDRISQTPPPINCDWPEHIEQLCELRKKCPIKKGMTDAEIVEKCPMYGSGKNVAEKASVRKAKQDKRI